MYHGASHKAPYWGQHSLNYYANDMCNINVSSVVKQLFAGDTNLFLVGDDSKEVCETMSFELDKLSRSLVSGK